MRAHRAGGSRHPAVDRYAAGPQPRAGLRRRARASACAGRSRQSSSPGASTAGCLPGGSSWSSRTCGSPDPSSCTRRPSTSLRRQFADGCVPRVGVRSYFPVVEHGEYLSVSLGNVVLPLGGRSGVAYEAGAYVLFGIVGLQLTAAPCRRASRDDRHPQDQVLLMRRAPWLLAVPAPATGCTGFFFSTPRARSRAASRSPRRDDARLAVLWVGHATALIQMDDKFVLTDPLLGDSVGQVSKRLQEPGHRSGRPAAARCGRHLAHALRSPVARLARSHRGQGEAPAGAPRGSGLHAELRLRRARAADVDVVRGRGPARDGRAGQARGLPLRHRRGVDEESFTGYVFEYHGLSVYFPGDTAYDGERLPRDRRALPAPGPGAAAHLADPPAAYMEATHVDPAEALQASSTWARGCDGAHPLRHADQRLRRPGRARADARERDEGARARARKCGSWRSANRP